MGNLWSGGEQAIRRRNEEARKQQILEAELRRRSNLEILERLQRQRQLEIRSRRIFATQHADVYQPNISRGYCNAETVSSAEKNSNYYLINYITNHSSTGNWEPMTSSDTIKYVDLLSTSQEYMQVAGLFRSTNKKFFKVTGIQRIQNPYLYGAYLLKKEELTSRLGQPNEKLVFHGTRKQNIDKICEDNLDWRLHGRGTGHRFGRGVSFSPISHYATHYCDKKLDMKVMLVVKVLISNSCVGNPETDLPPAGFDTTQKEDGHVVVKYYDNEYYPAYKLYFTQVNLCN